MFAASFVVVYEACYFSLFPAQSGEVAEWSNAPHSKRGILEIVS